MANWTPTEWAGFLIALGTFVNTVLIAVAGLFAALAKIRGDTNADKIDANTKVTKEGTEAAAKSAVMAANNVAHSRATIDSIDQKLNGGLIAAIGTFVNPVKTALEAHISKDATDKQEIKSRIDTMVEYVHQRNHDILDALQTQSTKLSLLLEKAEGEKK